MSRIGYSFWGFLGDGIGDTPDGGRSHRAFLIKSLVRAGFEVVMLQRDRDAVEAGAPVNLGQVYENQFPDIDILFLEWRWLIPGRNDRPNMEGFTPDWFRQQELIEIYCGKIPIIIWDKDQKFSMIDDELRKQLSNCGKIYVLEPSLVPSESRRIRALFPFDHEMIDPRPKPPRERGYSLVYVGNDYERREDFETYFVAAARHVKSDVFGKWPSPISASNITYHGRVGYNCVPFIYRDSIATLILAPVRYKKSGQYTQRVFEAVAKGCMPLFPADYAYVDMVADPRLIVHSSVDIPEKISWIKNLPYFNYLNVLKSQTEKLGIFTVEAIISEIRKIISGHAQDYFKDA